MEQWEYPEDLEAAERAFGIVPPTSVEENRELERLTEMRRQHGAIQWLLENARPPVKADVDKLTRTRMQVQPVRLRAALLVDEQDADLEGYETDCNT